MIKYVDADPKVIFDDMIKLYENIFGVQVYPAQPEYLFIRVLSYYLAKHKMDMNYAANQNLVKYADGKYLDALGEIMGVHRLSSQKAKCLLNICSVKGEFILPAGTVFLSNSTNLAFASETVCSVTPEGVDLPCVAISGGIEYNGLNDVTVLKNRLKHGALKSVRVVTPSVGGAEVENDERFRQRILESPESYSVAGSVGSYRSHALNVSASIKDVAVISPSPGEVDVYVLLDKKNDDIINEVKEKLSAEDVRPLTDFVSVYSAKEVVFDLSIRYKTYVWADVNLVSVAVAKAVDLYLANLGSQLGRDVVKSQIAQAVMDVKGVYSVIVEQPDDIIIKGHEVAIVGKTPVIQFDGSMEG